MSEPLDPRTGAPDPLEDDAVRALIKRALSADPDPSLDLLPGVQRRLRRRARGRLFRDGWSSTQMRTTVALVGIVTLLVAAIAYLTIALR